MRNYWPAIALFCLMLISVNAQARSPWRKALGDTSRLLQSEKIFFEDASSFRERQRGWGNSVRSYLRRWHNEPDRERSVLVIRWLGQKDRRIQGLKAYLEAFFQLPVRIQVVSDRTLPAPRSGKYSAEVLQYRNLEDLPSDAFSVLTLTDLDLFSEDSGPRGLLFGQGHYVNRTAVASSYRMKTRDFALYHHRMFKLVTHELVHTFALEHCGYFDCLMNSSGSIEGSDRRPLFLCPVCLRKLHEVVGFDPEKRYRDLLKASDQLLAGDKNWLRDRLSRANQ